MTKKIKLNTEFILLKLKEKGWSHYEFAGRINVVPNTLAKYLKEEETRIEIINRMAKALEVDANKLIYTELGE